MKVDDLFCLMFQANQPETTLRSVMFADEGGSIWLDDETALGERARGVFDLLLRNSSAPREVYHLCGGFQQGLRRSGGGGARVPSPGRSTQDYMICGSHMGR